MDEDAEFTKEKIREGNGVFNILNTQTPDEYYPLGIFNPRWQGQRLTQLDFEEITLLYGGNGSGKTTLLNIIAEKLKVFRHSPYLQTEVFAYYLEHCDYTYEAKTPNQMFLASDDIFDHILSVRKDNTRVKRKKAEEGDFFRDANYGDPFPDGIHLDFDDPNVKRESDKLRRVMEARRKTRRQFIRTEAGEMQRQFSNGENALMFFEEQIKRNALYFLDEPENSLSPRFQLLLLRIIDDAVRDKNCQFVIATHSPFILSLRGAKIYNLDASPVTVERWHDLDNVRTYYDFFNQHRPLFEQYTLT